MNSLGPAESFGGSILLEGNYLVHLLLKLWKGDLVIEWVVAFTRSAFPYNGHIVCEKK